MERRVAHQFPGWPRALSGPAGALRRSIATEKISGPPPVYTELARKARVEGVVIIEAIIDAQGDGINARVLRGMPMGLDRTALEAVEKWKFKPATLKGKPVKVYYTLTVRFKLQ